MVTGAILQERDARAPQDGRQRTGNAVGRGNGEVTEMNIPGEGLYLYLYGIIPNDGEPLWNLKGIRGAAAIYTIPQDGLSAVVSKANSEMFETTQDDLLAHNRVLEEVMKTHAVLPLRLGTMAKSEAEVKAFLQKAYRPLRDALGQIEGKVEFDVEAEWSGDFPAHRPTGREDSQI